MAAPPLRASPGSHGNALTWLLPWPPRVRRISKSYGRRRPGPTLGPTPCIPGHPQRISLGVMTEFLFRRALRADAPTPPPPPSRHFPTARPGVALRTPLRRGSLELAREMCWLDPLWGGGVLMACKMPWKVPKNAEISKPGFCLKTQGSTGQLSCCTLKKKRPLARPPSAPPPPECGGPLCALRPFVWCL